MVREKYIILGKKSGKSQGILCLKFSTICIAVFAEILIKRITLDRQTLTNSILYTYILGNAASTDGSFPKKFSQEELKKRLTNEQYSVTQKAGTER